MLKSSFFYKNSIMCMLLLFVISMLTACNSFEENSYKTLKSMAVAYTAVMDVAYEHYQGMDDADEKVVFWSEVKKYANPVRASIKTAKAACLAYSRAKAAYDAAQATGGDVAGLLEQVNATKAAASAALQTVDVKALKESIETIISLF